MKKTIDYTKIEFTDLRNELISYLKETNTFRDIDIEGSNIKTFVDIFAYIGQLFGFYIYSSANELFLPTAKKYGNLIKIAELLKYEARGTTSAKVNVVGSLNPEYVFSKEGQQIEIPAYSIFPSTRQTELGSNFQFTNIEPVNYIIKGYGIRTINQNDISYNGYTLPLTAPASFFTKNNVLGLNASSFTIPLSKYKQLRLIKRSDITNYRGFDTENYPSATSVSSQGQPYEKTIETVDNSNVLNANSTYYLVFNYSDNTPEPYLSIVSDPSILNNKEDDIVASFKLTPTDNTNQFYKLETIDVYSFNRFFVGTLGMGNLESTVFEFDTMANRKNSLEKLKLVINKDGTKPPFGVLINGSTYTFTSGTIESQKIKPDSFDLSVNEYNVNLCIDAPDSPEINYGARLEITTNNPLENQVTISKIFTQRTDSDTQTPTISTVNASRFGDIKLVEAIQPKTTNQKNGIITLSEGITSSKVIFTKPFTTSNYHISLSSTQNIRKWYANQNINGFTIYVEPESNFSGDIAWVATETIENNLTEMQVYFDKPLSTVLENNNSVSNYMVSLTPNENIEVWYENLTSEGFTIKTNRNFMGKVSWSAYNYYSDEFTPSENITQSLRQTGKVSLNGVFSYDVALEVPINDENYSIQLTSSENVKLWYTNKTSNGFTINVENNNITSDLYVNWSVESSKTNYQYQKHGEVEFKGQTTLNSYIPGLTFVNIPESFKIDNLYEGTPKISHINSNLVIDAVGNALQLSLDPHRIYEQDVKFVVGNEKISSNSIRIFVKNKDNKWDEWERTGFVYNKVANVGEKVYKVSMNSDGKLCIEFGNGIVWGTSISDTEVVIFGLESVGSSGNIVKGTLSQNIVISQYIVGNDVTSVDFEQNLINLIGLKSKLTFTGNNVETSIIDTENTKLNFTDLTITQNKNAFGGNDKETIDELRQNANNFFVSQNRLVSLDDYNRYIASAFSDHLLKTQVLSFKETKEKNLIPSSEPTNYWFNYIFIVGLNKDGSNTISQNLKNFLIDTLNNSTFRMIGVEHEIITATWVPIDIAIRYKKQKGGSYQNIETQIKNNLVEYFADASLHTLGESIYHSKICSLISSVDNIENFEVMLNKNPNNKLQSSDYNVNFSTSDADVNIARRNKLMELVAKDPSLVKIYQPLFDTLNVDGTREWNYSLDINLEQFEYPKIGNVIIERQ
jgi:hypothetical protein